MPGSIGVFGFNLGLKIATRHMLINLGLQRRRSRFDLKGSRYLPRAVCVDIYNVENSFIYFQTYISLRESLGVTAQNLAKSLTVFSNF